MTEIEKELNRRADIIIRQEKQIEIDAEQIRALQKQNKELQEEINEKCMRCDKVGKWRNYNSINEKVAQSYKEENAELKEALKGKRCNCMTYFNFKDLENNLTNAKEIIRAYKNICNNAPFLTEEEVELKVKAEQFLKEVEK